MATKKEPLDDEVAGVLKAHQKAQSRVRETALDLARVLRAAVRDGRIAKKDAEHITRTYAKE